MTLAVRTLTTLDDIDPDEYRAFFLQSRAPIFYDWRFLQAAQHSPLLQVHKTFYFLVHQHGRLVGFLPAYLQNLAAVDPLGVLLASAGLRDEGSSRGLFSHVMHCFDSTVAMLSPAREIHAALFNALSDAAHAENARYFGLLNLPDGPVLREAAHCGLRIDYMVDRYRVDISAFNDFDHFVRLLSREGRQEMVRQLRKFASSGARARVIGPPFGDILEQLSQLCQQTTARRGTPHYFPAAELARFTRLCGDLVRLCVIEVDDRLVSGFICFQEAGTFHLWSAGVVYDQTPFSPYTMIMATSFRHAFDMGLKRLEGGRLNARIKARLGLQPMRLYTAIGEIRHRSSAAQAPSADQSFARALDGEIRFGDHPAFEDWLRIAAWNGRTFSRRPQAIVRAANEGDVVRTIAYARQQGLCISVRGGGHSYAGCFLRTGTLLLDVSGLNELAVDAIRSRAIAGPGVQGGQLSAALAAHGLAFPTGHGRGVAISGFLLGGGLGINCAQWGGMSTFNIEALDIVDAEGRALHVDAQHDPDLFWAARGSGPSAFFVVTRFYLKCWPLPGAIANSLYTTSVDRLDAVLQGIERADPPTNLQVMVVIASDAQSGAPVVLVNTLAFAGSPEQASRLRASFIEEVAEALVPLTLDQPASFETIYQQADAMLVSKRYRSDNILTNRTKDIAQILQRHLPSNPSRASVMLLIWRGLEPHFPDAACSATGRFFVSTYAQWNTAADDSVNFSWLHRLYDDFQSIASSAYINEFDLESRSADVGRCFSDGNWDRLLALRQKYDPHGLFVRIETLAQKELAPAL